jgi:hypothetical protein
VSASDRKRTSEDATKMNCARRVQALRLYASRTEFYFARSVCFCTKIIYFWGCAICFGMGQRERFKNPTIYSVVRADDESAAEAASGAAEVPPGGRAHSWRQLPHVGRRSQASRCSALDTIEIFATPRMSRSSYRARSSRRRYERGKGVGAIESAARFLQSACCPGCYAAVATSRRHCRERPECIR